MTSHGQLPPGDQGPVDDYFHRVSDYWETVYDEQDVQGQIYRERRLCALAWIDALGLPPGSEVLEIGCGAGSMSVVLARRGFAVRAMDSAPAMVQRARERVQAEGLSEQVALSTGDAHALEEPDAAFDLVVALGVIPWLHSPGQAMAEMSRVLRPGGRGLITADNRIRLNHLLDPRLNPALKSTRVALRPLAARFGWSRSEIPEGFEPAMHRRRDLDVLVAGAGLEPIRSTTVGFGPFSLLGRRVMGDPRGLRAHARLQRLADGDVPVIRATGSHLVVLTEKPRSAA